MHLETSILILSPAETVWNILLDFEAYALWNPFILSISGKPEVGEQLEAKIQDMVFKPIVLISNPNTEFRWIGKLGFKGLFDGEHYFKIESLKNGTCMLHHGEMFSGLLVPLFKNKLKKETKTGFQKMNEALKIRAEAMKP